MSAPAYQFPASLPVPESQPAGQVLIITSQDKFASPGVLLTGVGADAPADSSQIPSKDTYVNPALTLPCLGDRSSSPPPGELISSSDTYASEGVLLNVVIPK
jgi:hypothetical protein